MNIIVSLREWYEEDRKQALIFLVAALALALSFFEIRPGGIDPAWLTVLLCGVPIVRGAAEGLWHDFDIKADVLVSLALIAAVIIGEIFAAGEVAFIMQLGAMLEERTVAKARAGIEKLVRLTPRTARRLEGDAERLIPAEQVAVGDLLRVLPGETIPVDGVITEGRTSINQAVMTGESLPVDKEPGDTVCSGTVNQFGAFDMRAIKVGEDSALQRMIRLVQSADAGKARIVGMADRWATWIVVGALASAAATWMITGEILRAVTILVVFCPCALVLATPTAIMAAIGNATRNGMLVREGDALERLAEADVIAFDKTGTLTRGRPDVHHVYSALTDCDSTRLLALTAAAESRSEHPLGKAIAAACPEHPAPQSFRMLPGRGVEADVAGHRLLAGNLALLADQGIAPAAADETAAAQQRAEGCTLVHLALDGRYAGFIALADELREDAADTVNALRASGVRVALLTGDHEEAARHAAAALQLDDLRAACLPEDKLRWIDDRSGEGRKVCMIGDGINDAPALKKSFVGIAMGGIGSDIAVDAADMALVHDDIRRLPHMLALSRRMMRVIGINLAFSLLLNFAAIFLAMAGLLSPVAGALVHNAGSVLVIVHSALLLHWQKDPGMKKRQEEALTSTAPRRNVNPSIEV